MKIAQKAPSHTRKLRRDPRNALIFVAIYG